MYKKTDEIFHNAVLLQIVHVYVCTFVMPKTQGGEPHIVYMTRDLRAYFV